MRRWIWVLLLGAACREDEVPVGLPPDGSTGWVSCHSDDDITYQYGCGWEDEEGTCVPPDDLCDPYVEGTFAGSLEGFCDEQYDVFVHDEVWEDGLDADCAEQCPGEVRDQACSIGRYAEEIGGCDTVHATHEAADCDTMEMRRELELTWTPRVGAPVAATGTVRYVLDPPGRTGRTGRLFSVSLDTPLTVTVATTAASWLTGYRAGTQIAARSARLTGTLPLSLDSAGRTTIQAGTLTVVVGVTIAEPGGVPRTLDIHAAVPWSLTLTATDTTFTIARFTDAFGGVFSATSVR